MGIGLTFDEYVDVKLKPPAGADRAFQQAAELERVEMFPMNAAAASSHLRSRGYDCRPAMLERLLRHFLPEVGSVCAPYPSRWDPDYVVWDYQRADSPGVHRIKPPAPDTPQLQEIRGSGFGCVVLRTDLLRNHVFSIPPGELYYDPYFWETVGDEWKRLCDWSCVCRHLIER